MRLLRSFPLLAFMLVLLSIVGLCVAQKSVGLLLVAGALAALSWYVTEGPRGRALPKWVSNILVLAISLNVIVDVWQHPNDFLGVLGRFTVWLTLIKLYERRGPRDQAHLLALSLLLVMTGCLQSTDLLFGVILALYAVLGLYVLLLYQLHASHAIASGERQRQVPEGYRIRQASQPIIGRHVGLHFRGLVFAVAVMGLLLSSLVFVAFPRDLGSGFMSRVAAGRGARSMTGFAPQVDLLSSTRISTSRSRVMVVQVIDADGAPIRLAPPLYLRGAALPRYGDGGRWLAGPTEYLQQVPTEADEFSHLAPVDPAAPPPVTVSVTMSMPTPVLFSPYAAIAVRTGDVPALMHDRKTQLLRTVAGEAVDGYELSVPPVLTTAQLDVLVSDDGRPGRFGRKYRRAPVRELARRLLDEARLPAPSRSQTTEWWAWACAASRHFAGWLQSGAFTYTTDISDIRIDPDRDPIEQFLLDPAMRRGHCEYFASALTALCHSVDIEARVITGFVAYEFDEDAMRFDVLQANAHAWVEVRTGPRQWTTMDPTPAATLRELHEGTSTIADRLLWLYQRLEGGWTSGVVGYDARSQAGIAGRLDGAWTDRFRRAWQSVRDWLARVNAAFYLGPAGYIWMGFVAFVLVIAIVTYFKLRRRSRRLRAVMKLDVLRGREFQRLLRQLGFYLDMLAVLDRAGVPKPAWLPPRRFAAELAGDRPRPGAVVTDLTELFYRARYGGEELTKDEITRAQGLVDELAGALKVRR